MAWAGSEQPVEGRGTSWVDIGPTLQRAQDALHLGELLRAPDFGLFASMSAVEIGNPKLDTGMKCNRCKSLDELVASGMAPPCIDSGLTLGVMDRLLTLEAMWHSGHNLAQTVFTCLYLLRPARLDMNPVLRVFSHALLQTCAVVRDLVMRSYVADEEDFLPHTFGLPLPEPAGMGEEGARQMEAKLTHCIGQLEDLGRQLGKPGAPEAGELSEGCSVRVADIPGLLVRLKLRRSFLQGLLRVRQRRSADLGAASAAFRDAQVQFAEVAACASPQQESAAAAAFNSMINHSRMAPAPPRKVSVQSWERTQAYWTRMLDDMQAACAVAGVASFRQLVQFLSSFSLRRAGSLPRSAVHYQILVRGRSEDDLPAWAPSRALLCKHMHCPLPGLPSCPQVQLFVEQAQVAMAGWCSAMCRNRSRLQRRLRRDTPDWMHLHQHALNAEDTDDFQAYLQSSNWRWPQPRQAGGWAAGPLARWVEKECCLRMRSHLQLGFELQLYSPAEYGQIYWYCDYLLINVLNCLKTLADARPRLEDGDGGSKVKKGKGKAAAGVRSAAAASSPAERAEAQHHWLQVMQLEAERMLCAALVRMLLGLYACGCHAPEPGPFNSAAERFEQRFGAFQKLQAPAPLSYEAYQASTDASGKQPKELFQSALEFFTAALQHLLLIRRHATAAPAQESLDTELSSLVRVCRQNSVGCQLLVARCSSPRDLNVGFDFQHHSVFPAVTIKSGGPRSPR